MPNNELICPTHGPYPAHMAACPRCSGAGSRPQAPRPLEDEDNMPTDLGYGIRAPAAGRGADLNQDDMPTDLPVKHRNKRGILDGDDEETGLGAYGRGTDHTVLDVKQSGVEIIFWVKEGNQNRRGQIFKIRPDSTIGRKDSDITLDDPKVSNLHAKVTCEEGQYYIWDLASKNGVFVNGERIWARTPLKENDMVKMGDTIVVVKRLD